MAVGPISAIPAVGQPAGVTAPRPVPGQGDPFSRVMADMLKDANQQHLQSDRILEQFAAGETDRVHDVVLAAAKADLSFRMVLEIRNRLIESYQEIMRMQF